MRRRTFVLLVALALPAGAAEAQPRPSGCGRAREVRIPFGDHGQVNGLRIEVGQTEYDNFGDDFDMAVQLQLIANGRTESWRPSLRGLPTPVRVIHGRCLRVLRAERDALVFEVAPRR